MRVLVACEFSGIVRDAFIKKGHDAVSCDLLDSERGGFHIQGDAIHAAYEKGIQGSDNDWGWDLMIAHPPCTYLAVSGARWFKDRQREQEEALEFIQALMDAPIDKICIENPIGVISTKIRKPDQIIQPWQFGHGETKATCLWLKNLPLLVPTDVVEGRESRIHKMPPSKNRGKLRSITYQGVANAMASQWNFS
jgi:site-specific DNA-cytosine methylase